MTVAPILSETWIEHLPPVRGRIHMNVPLGPLTWFRVGGPADVVFRPADRDDLVAFLGQLPAEVPITVLGVGSNLLVRDGGVRGVVIRLSGDFNHLVVTEDTIEASATALDSTLAQTALEHSRQGLEFLCGIPGTLGGALRMNAGAYNKEIKDVVLSATALDRYGKLHTLSNQDMGFSYRHSSVPGDWIFLSATLAAPLGIQDDIVHRMDEIRNSRETAQPIRTRTGGSTFANPPGHRAWELIDLAGCRGLVRGGAKVSEKHCNFLINTGTATAADLEDLGEEVRDRVKNLTGVSLEWEIRRIGERV